MSTNGEDTCESQEGFEAFEYVRKHPKYKNAQCIIGGGVTKYHITDGHGMLLLGFGQTPDEAWKHARAVIEREAYHVR